MKYEYNPLLKDCLQKKQNAATPEDVEQLQSEIDALTADVANKVTKFFASIDELEINEIGEYQGETNETFTNGYFYKRLNGGLQPNFVEISQLVAQSKYVSSYEHIVCYSLLTSGELPSDVINLDENFCFEVSVSYEIDGNEYSIHFFMFPPEVGLKSSYSIPSIQLFYNQEGYLFDYVFYAQGHYVGYDPLSARTPIFEDENGLYFIISDDKIYIKDIPIINKYSWGLTEQLTFYSGFYSPINGKYIESRLLRIKSWLFAFIIPINATDLVHDGTFDVISYNLSYWESVDTPFDVYGLSYEDVPAFLRIDTQPSLDPDNFATATQGAKADTALQSISKGTDGNYINTTVTAKDANNQQTVGASLTIQDITSADNDHRGLLEALNTRNYIDTQIYKVSLNFFFYGVQWDENDPSPDCTRIGNMSLHAELPIQNAIIGGLLQDDLTFTPFADQSDWSGETVDGSAGQLMLQIPKHYFKSEINGTIHKKLISQYPLAGFIEIPMMYVSAEKATVDRTDPTTPKLCSVVNSSPEFRGGQNTADWDNTYRSLLGKPASNISLTNFRQYARNRGNGTVWNCHTYLAQRVLYWLFVTEYATLNSQKAFNAAKDANGYAQGGLGPGVSNWNGDAWQAYNNYNPLIPCGYMLEFGNRSAIKNFSVKDANDNILVTFEVNSYRGIQSPFADIWDWMDGILINVQSDAAGGVSTCYVTDDPAKFSSTDFSQYREVGGVPRAENWIKTIYDGEAGDIICKSIPGSSTSYYCDYYWGLNLPASGVSLRGVLFGGSANHGSRCGFLSATSVNVPGYVALYLGSRLCAFPSP